MKLSDHYKLHVNANYGATDIEGIFDYKFYSKVLLFLLGIDRIVIVIMFVDEIILSCWNLKT